MHFALAEGVLGEQRFVDAHAIQLAFVGGQFAQQSKHGWNVVHGVAARTATLRIFTLIYHAASPSSREAHDMISSMKRRGFVKTLIALPAAPALAAPQQAAKSTGAGRTTARRRTRRWRRQVRPGQYSQVRADSDRSRRRADATLFHARAIRRAAQVERRPDAADARPSGSARMRGAGVSGFPDRRLARRPANALPQRSGHAERPREKAVQQIVRGIWTRPRPMP